MMQELCCTYIGSWLTFVLLRYNYSYHIFSRQNQFNTLIHGQRLFQQLLCDMYACVDDNMLNWYRNNQDLIRSDLYRGVIDALNTDEPVRNLGQPVILAASYHGGDRQMTKSYQVRYTFICDYLSNYLGYLCINLNLYSKLTCEFRMLWR